MEEVGLRNALHIVAQDIADKMHWLQCFGEDGVIAVAVVHRRAIIRRGLGAILADISGVQLVAEFSDARSLLEHVKRDPPDVLLMEPVLDDMSASDVAQRLCDEGLLTRVILIVPNGADWSAADLAGASIAGCLETQDGCENDLPQALETVKNGGFWMKRGSSRRQGEGYRALSAREREVLSLMGKGLSNLEIAGSLRISVCTVQNHSTAICRKLGVSDRTRAIIHAVSRGLVSLEDMVRPDT